MRRRRRGSRALRWGLLGGGLLALLTCAAAALILFTGVGAAAGAGVIAAFLDDLPSVDEIAVAGDELFQTTTISDRRGRPLGEPLGLGRRKIIPPEEIPQVVKLAVIASEDATFYENPGVEPRAILRALWQNWRGGVIVSGGSTITQQLVKNLLLTAEETVERKLREAVLAWQISQRFSKDEILGLYLNQNFYGGLAYGVAAAAQTYFGKELGQVTLAEAAMLAGILRSPSINNPHANPEAARREQLRVLDLVERNGFAPPDRVAAARREEVSITPPAIARVSAPHFLNYVLDELQTRYGPEVSRRGWEVITTLDLDKQEMAEEAARAHVATLREKDATNAALVALRPATGEILAMVGSLDFNDRSIDGQVNVTLAPRQPGSSFKPITYAAALLAGYTPATMLLDIPTTVPIEGQASYSPRNYDRRFRGPVSLRTALGSSLNVPAVRTQLFAGVDDTAALARRLGLTTLDDPARLGPAMALGSNEVRLLELAAAYGVLANSGRRVEPVAILCIRDARGRIVEQFGDGCSPRVLNDANEQPRAPLPERVIGAEVAFLITSILADDEARVLGFGETRKNLELIDRPAAVKTGTTEETRDALTVGYVPQLVTAVWVGNSDGRPMDGVTGVRGAAPIWQDFMQRALAGEPVRPWERPATIVEAEVDAVSGLLPTPYSPLTRTEYFLPGTVPAQRDVVHQPFLIHRSSGLLATPGVPLEQVEERVFAVLPKEAEAWQRRQPPDSPLALPPERFAAQSVTTADSQANAALAWPEEGGFVRSILEVLGTARGAGFNGYELHFGEGATPHTWLRVGDASDQPVENDKLAVMDTIELPEGIFTLRLTVHSSDGGGEQVFRRFGVDNTPPTAEISGITDGALIEALPTELGVRAEDAWGVAEVEYFVDGKSVGLVRRAPFSLTWTPQSGAHLVTAQVKDRAGNAAFAAPVKVRVP